MGNGIKERSWDFIGGSVGGGICGISILQASTSHHWYESLVKLLGLCVIATCTGLCTVAGADLWKTWLRKRVIKRKDKIALWFIKIFKSKKHGKSSDERVA